MSASDRTNGMSNQCKIEQIDDWRNKYPAFAWCADLGEGWYLPAIEELKQFLLDGVLDKVNRTLQEMKAPKLFVRDDRGWYWSSTECNEFSSWLVNIVNGDTYHNYKSYRIYVRAVSAF